MSTPVCPRCQEEVSLPHGASPRALVECPLCLEQYPLSEALRGSPPLLKVIDDPDAGLVAVGEPVGEFRLAGEKDEFATVKQGAMAHGSPAAGRR
jgi:hypothetical protein